MFKTNKLEAPSSSRSPLDQKYLADSTLTRTLYSLPSPQHLKRRTPFATLPKFTKYINCRPFVWQLAYKIVANVFSDVFVEWQTASRHMKIAQF